MQQLDFHHTLIIFWVLPITYHAQAHTQQNIVLTIGLLRKKRFYVSFRVRALEVALAVLVAAQYVNKPCYRAF